jgi:hypothetical protein
VSSFSLMWVSVQEYRRSKSSWWLPCCYGKLCQWLSLSLQCFSWQGEHSAQHPLGLDCRRSDVYGLSTTVVQGGLKWLCPGYFPEFRVGRKLVILSLLMWFFLLCEVLRQTEDWTLPIISQVEPSCLVHTARKKFPGWGLDWLKQGTLEKWKDPTRANSQLELIFLNSVHLSCHVGNSLGFYCPFLSQVLCSTTCVLFFRL